MRFQLHSCVFIWSANHGAPHALKEKPHSSLPTAVSWHLAEPWKYVHRRIDANQQWKGSKRSSSGGSIRSAGALRTASAASRASHRSGPSLLCRAGVGCQPWSGSPGAPRPSSSSWGALLLYASAPRLKGGRARKDLEMIISQRKANITWQRAEVGSQKEGTRTWFTKQK